MGKWSNLPLDLLYVIEDSVDLYIDKVRLRAVNLEWNSQLSKLPDHRDKKIHFLLHPLENNEKKEDEATHGLFNPLDKKLYNLCAPELTGMSFKGSSFGWIIATQHIDTGLNGIYLTNPMTRAQIKLPPRTKFADGVFCFFGPEGVRMIDNISSDFEFDPVSSKVALNKYHTKIVLSSDPFSDGCVVIATFCRGFIAWCNCNGKNWTCIDPDDTTGFVDILYSKGYLYALTYEGRVTMFENIGTEFEIKSKEITSNPIPIPEKRSAYLAECSDGSLIVVVPSCVCDANKDRALICTKEFKVYKLCSNPNSSWVEVKSIGDDVLFVGFGSVRSIPSSDLPGFKKNHIYFCDLAKPLPRDENGNLEMVMKEDLKSYVGVFSLEDGSLKPLQGLGDFNWSRPIWTNIGQCYS